MRLGMTDPGRAAEELAALFYAMEKLDLGSFNSRFRFLEQVLGARG